MSDDREDRIRQRAYQLWQADGSPEGGADEYWHKASAQVDAETQESEPAIDQAAKRNMPGDPLQESGAIPPAEEARDKRRRR